MVALEEHTQVWQLECELVHVELQLERWQRDEFLLLSVVLLLVLVCQNNGNHGEQNDGNNDLPI